MAKRIKAHPGDAIFAPKVKRALPFDFVLETLSDLDPETKPMFGCTAIYVGDKIVLILREKGDEDDGVWLATTHEHHASLKRELPSMRSISLFGPKVTGWQNLPAESATFEEDALRACEIVRAGDARIGKVPASRSKPGAARKGGAKNAARETPKEAAKKTKGARRRSR